MEAKRDSLVAIVVSCLLLVGCSPKATQTNDTAPTSKKLASAISADEILKKLIQAYQETDGYGDQAILRLSYELDGEMHYDSASLAVRVARPNRARVQVYQTDIACDGQLLMARITDESTNNMDEQWLVRAAPAKLSLTSLLDDTVLYDVISSGLGRMPIQLELLLSESPLEEFLAANVERKILDERIVQGAKCHRVGITTAEGTFVLWIDKQQFILRRFEYPPAVLLANLPADENPRHVELIAEFNDVRLESTIADARSFKMPIPDDARQVRYFVRPPQPLPSNLFGERIAEFQFTKVDGAEWSSRELTSKIAVLHWYIDHPACQASLQQWEQVRRRYANDARVKFIAVCVDPSSVSHSQIHQVLRAWNVEAEVVRDLNTTGPDVFGIGPLPAVVVLDTQQKIQAFWVTYNPDLANQLPTAIDQLIEGQDLAGQALAQLHNDVSEYHHTLAAAGANENQTVLTAQTAPEHWRMTKAWEAPFHEPGNMLVVSRDEGNTRLLVLEEGRVVLELDQSGRSLGAHRLPVPESENITHLRAAADGSAYVAFSYGGRRAYWLDAQWQLVRAVPDHRLRHDGIRDAVFVRNKNEWMLCVAAADVGLLAITAAGKTEWQLTQPQIQSLAVHPPSGQLIAADASGRVFGVGAGGQEYPVADKQGSGVFRVVPIQAPPGEEGSDLAGVSYLSDSARLIYGLNEEFQGLWEYRLPGDPFRYPTEYIASATANGTAYWVLASADGAIHLLSADGRDHDYYFTGAHISGLQALAGQHGLLVVLGSENAVTAWNVEPLTEAPVAAPADRSAATEREPILSASAKDGQ